MTQQQQLIADIRKQYSGLDDMPRNSLNASINTLAHDLYAKETHFIFELIQNAEDNHYADTRPPMLRFALKPITLHGAERVSLLVENNETGFEPAQVKALCQVGQSTKTSAEGYIGEKGIGFKSVFRITDCPHVFSDGYRFSLAKEDVETGLGYIVPRWVENLPPSISARHTAILLPLENGSVEQSRAIAEKLKDIAPETILFLRKLKSLEISICLAGDDYEILIEKDDKTRPQIATTHVTQCSGQETLVTQHYWTRSESFDVPAWAAHAKRKDIKTRELTVAIPISRQPQPGKLFAYLPVWESTGLPFLVNADFLLVSSREGLHVDAHWNEWLRDQIPQVYVGAFLQCLAECKLPDKHTVYASIPLAATEAFLGAVPAAICDRLAHSACVATEPSGKLVPPESSVHGVPKALRPMLCNGAIPAHIVDRVVLPDLEVYSQQLSAIGAPKWSETDALECLKDQTWLEAHAAEWLVNLYSVLSKMPWSNKPLRSVRMVPVSGGTNRLLCDRDMPIYFPCDAEAKGTIETLPEWFRELVPLAFVDTAFMALIDQKDPKLAEWMTDELSIFPFTVSNFAVDLYNVMQNKHATLSAAQVVEMTLFILRNADASSSVDWKTLPVALSNGRVVRLDQALPGNGTLVVPAAENPGAGWQHIFASAGDRNHFISLSDEYCEAPWTEAERKQLYTRLAARQYPLFRFQSLESWQLHDLPEDEGAIVEQGRNRAAASRINDTKLVRVNRPSAFDTVSNGLAAAMESWLQAVLAPLISRYSVGTLSVAEYRLHEIGLLSKCVYQNRGSGSLYIGSSVLRWLKEKPWLHTTKGLTRPGKAFLASNATKEVFGDLVPYYAGELPKEITTYLGVREGITAAALIQLLTEEQQKDQPDLTLLTRVYAQCGARMGSGTDSIDEKLSAQDLIFVPDNSGTGQWKRISDLTGGEIAAFQNRFGSSLDQLFRRITGEEERESKRVHAVQAAVANGASAEAVTDFLSRPPDEQARIMEQFKRPAFPSRPVRDPERRQARKEAQHSEQADRQYERRERSVRTTGSEADPRTYLIGMYTNDDGEMVCQLCQKSLGNVSFTKLDGEPYFEAVEFLRHSTDKEDEANHLLLCPVCAAKFRELVKSQYGTEDSPEPLFTQRLRQVSLAGAAEQDLCIYVSMSSTTERLRFVEKHWSDLQAIVASAEA